MFVDVYDRAVINCRLPLLQCLCTLYCLPLIGIALFLRTNINQPQSATVNFGQLLSDRQLIEIVEIELNDSSKDIVMNMNDIHQMYSEPLDENEVRVPDNPRYKPYLKQLIP